MNGENDSTRVLETPDLGLTGRVGQTNPLHLTLSLLGAARRGRSGTRMMEVSLSQNTGTKLEIHFDENLQPFGPNKSTYTSFVGALVRSKKIMEKYQEIGRKNDCPHGASCGGYEKAEKDLMATKRKRLEDEAESNPSTVVDRPPSPIRREELVVYSAKAKRRLQ
ncbi:hypothetical protein K1719_033923 [Acacia pycnantha]|nr:hypothetical protein K1719_033923 [Acacia pycnantha]